MEHDTAETAHAWHYNGSGAAQSFTTLGGATSSVRSINNTGVAVGASSTGSVSHATRWLAPTLPQDIHPQGVSSLANGINDAGVIVGVYTLANDDSRAFRRNADGSANTLPMLPGNVDSTALHINENGWMIGHMKDTNFEHDYVLWKPDGSVYDLHEWVKQVNPLEGNRWQFFESVDGISDDGLIVGWGYYNDGPGGLPTDYRSFVLDASTIPEPSSALTLLVAAALLTVARAPRLSRYVSG
jgi:hypothetical protein